MLRKVAGAVVVVLALGVAGCGGGGKTLTKAEFVRQLNAICTSPQKTSTTRAARRENGPTAFLMSILDRQKQMEAQFKGIKPPSELGSSYDQFKKVQAQRMALIERAITVVKADPKHGLQSLTAQGKALQTQLTRAASDLGVRHCA